MGYVVGRPNFVAKGLKLGQMMLEWPEIWYVAPFGTNHELGSENDGFDDLHRRKV